MLLMHYYSLGNKHPENCVVAFLGWREIPVTPSLPSDLLSLSLLAMTVLVQELVVLVLFIIIIVKVKVKRHIAVCRQACHHRYGNSHTIWDHTVLPATRHRGDIPAFTPAEAGTRFSDPRGMQG